MIYHYKKDDDNFSELRTVTFLAVLLALIFFFIILVHFASTASAEPAYSDEQIVNAIYKAEGGSSAQYAYGIRSVHYDTKAEARRICLNTVRNNRKRYADYGHKRYSTYLEFLASRYCPVGADNDPKGLNKNWLKNVRYFLERG